MDARSRLHCLGSGLLGHLLTASPGLRQLRHIDSRNLADSGGFLFYNELNLRPFGAMDAAFGLSFVDPAAGADSIIGRRLRRARDATDRRIAPGDQGMHGQMSRPEFGRDLRLESNRPKD